MRRNRQTKIVATVGPAAATVERLQALFEAGADVFRLNFSHGDRDEHAARLAHLHAVEARVGRPIAVFADLQGPKLRLGKFVDGRARLATGSAFRLELGDDGGDDRRAPLPHTDVFAALRPGALVLIDDGRVRLQVTAAGADYAETQVLAGGVLSDRKGVNLPDVELDRSPLTAKDRADLAFALEHGITLVALSFVQRPEDLLEARALIGRRARLIAKLEKPQAIRHLDRIVERADALMVARGDLGVEVPPEDVPSLQKRIVRACRAAGKPVIVATQMLESMMGAPTPTRAEASDVAHAVFEGADAVMLSGETAAGRFPVEAVAMMDRIIRRTERDPAFARIIEADRVMPETTDADAITAAARNAALTIGAAAIVTFTTTGSTTLRACRERPPVPILALTPEPVVAHALRLAWGVYPILVPLHDTFEDVIGEAIACATRAGFARAGDCLVVTAGLPLAMPGNTNALHIVHIPDTAAGSGGVKSGGPTSDPRTAPSG
jgi:pyruvate kinase